MSSDRDQRANFRGLQREKRQLAARIQALELDNEQLRGQLAIQTAVGAVLAPVNDWSIPILIVVVHSDEFIPSAINF